MERVQREIRRFPIQDRLAAGVVLTGGGAKIRAIESFVEKKLGLRAGVGIVRPFGNNFHAVTDVDFATVIGLLKYSVSVQTLLDFPETQHGIFSRFRRAAGKMLDRFFRENY